MCDICSSARGGRCLYGGKLKSNILRFLLLSTCKTGILQAKSSVTKHMRRNEFFNLLRRNMLI